MGVRRVSAVQSERVGWRFRFDERRVTCTALWCQGLYGSKDYRTPALIALILSILLEENTTHLSGVIG